MERPNPVIWTDREAGRRILEKMYSSGTLRNEWWDANISNNSQLFEQAFGYCLETYIGTPNSLLHDLNIIKPIGRLEYTSEWIDKILWGQKTMDIIPIQHACGYYELWDIDRQEVRGIVEVTNTQKLSDMDSLMRNDIASFYNRKKVYNCGFDSTESFIDHHRTHFQSVKYAITYQVVDMKGDNNA